MVYIGIPAEEALSAESLHVYGHSIAWLYIGYLRADFFHHSYHFVAHGYTRNSTRHASMLDMQVTGTDTAHRHTNNGIVDSINVGFGFSTKANFPFSI
jgi:hypothetical protein